MCKHIAAVLYGVGARLAQEPELLFSLRRVDAKDLVSQAGAGLPKSKKDLSAGKVLDHSMLADVFGIEIDESVVPAKTASTPKKPTLAKASAKKAVTGKTATPAKKSKKTVVNGKVAVAKKTVLAKRSVKI